MSEAEDPVGKSIALLESVGFHLVPLALPIAGAWDLLAVSPRGLTVIAAVTEKPTLLGTRYQLPPGWPLGTVRLILHWPADAPRPTAITLS